MNLVQVSHVSTKEPAPAENQRPDKCANVTQSPPPPREKQEPDPGQEEVDGLACRDGARKRGHEEDDVRRVEDRHLDIREEGRTKEGVGVPERKFSARQGGSQEGFCGKEVDEEVVGHHRLPTERHPQ